jgi:hypothetical protein
MALHPVKTASYVPPERFKAAEHKLRDNLSQPPHGINFYDNTDIWYAICWEWQGKVRKDGQAYVYITGIEMPIQRFAYLLWNGEVPGGLYARPIVCGTKLCCAPHHLELIPRGYHQRQLTDKQRDDIHHFYHQEEGPWTLERLAQTWKVSERLIRHIVGRRKEPVVHSGSDTTPEGSSV